MVEEEGGRGEVDGGGGEGGERIKWKELRCGGEKGRGGKTERERMSKKKERMCLRNRNER